MIKATDEKIWHLYTDGSGDSPPQKIRIGTWACVIKTPKGHHISERGFEHLQDGACSTRMELAAVLYGLWTIPSGTIVRIFCDSQYAKGILTALLRTNGEWKGVLARKNDPDLKKSLAAAVRGKRIQIVSGIHKANAPLLHRMCDMMAGDLRREIKSFL